MTYMDISNNLFEAIDLIVDNHVMLTFCPALAGIFQCQSRGPYVQKSSPSQIQPFLSDYLVLL